MCYLLRSKISSEETSRILHKLANVTNEGIIFPDKYWERVGFDIPRLAAICDFDK